MSVPRTHCPCGTPLTPETRFNHEAVCRPCGTLKAREAYRRHIAKYPKGMTAMDKTETRTCRLGIYMTDDERHRIGAAATFDRAEKAYTKILPQESDGIRKNWLYVVMNDVDVSKDRHTMSDAVASFSNQDEGRLDILTNFSTYVFIDTTQSLTGARAQEIIYGELFDALLKTLFGFKEDNEKSRFLAVPTGHGQGGYNSAWYAQNYEWQMPQLIDWQSGFSDPQDVAGRDYCGDLRPFVIENYESLELNINMDEVPL